MVANKLLIPYFLHTALINNLNKRQFRPMHHFYLIFGNTRWVTWTPCNVSSRWSHYKDIQ